MPRLALNWNDPTVRAFAKAAFPSYNGKHFYLNTVEAVDITNSYWDEGERSTFALLKLSMPPQAKQLPNFLAPQFGGPKEPQIVVIEPGFAVVEHHEGRWESVTFYLNPVDAAPLLPSAPVDLSEDEKFVLAATCGLTSKGRKDERENRRFSQARWDAAAELLKARGYLDKRGAATVEGKNARTNLGLRV